jgi:F-type H+-transporting ATPase subunit gamma
MRTLEGLSRKIESAEKLLATVRTMKTLAAANVKHYEKAVDALEHYNRTIEMSLQAVLKGMEFSDQPSGGDHKGPVLMDGKPVLAIVFGSDHGFAGHFNEDIAAFVSDVLGEARLNGQNSHIFCIGEQAASQMSHREYTVSKIFSVPNSIAGIQVLIHEILIGIEALRTGTGVEQAWLFYNRTLHGTSMVQEMDMIMPIDLTKYRNQSLSWPSRCLPVYTIEKERLLSALIQQQIFVMLYRGVAISLAAENNARLAAMQAANKNIEEMLDESLTEYRQQRQGMITSEILDIAGGAAALGDQKERRISSMRTRYFK